MAPVFAPNAPAEDDTGYTTTFFPGTSVASEAQRVTVASGQTISDVVFAMVPAKTARVSGTVTDSHGAPAQGMLMISREEPGSVMSGIASGASIRPDGTFTFSNVPPGNYTIRARLMGQKPETGVAKLVVASVDITDLRLTTVPPSRATGRIIVDAGAAQGLASATLSVVATPLDPAPLDGGGRPRRGSPTISRSRLKRPQD